ncbi:MAG: class 1 fructose-bisphosphatase [Pseudomonadota bacterium]
MDRKTEGAIRSAALITLQSHILAEEEAAPVETTGTLSWIMSAISISAKVISSHLRRARLEDVLGEAGGEDNVQGERQQKLDVIANETLIQILRSRSGVAAIGSEEDEELIMVASSVRRGARRYAVLFDPLDGSSNLDVGGTVGTIYSIFRVDEDATDALQPGTAQVAAGYVLYGSSTIMVNTTGSGVSMFVLDTNVGAFIRVAQDLRIPPSGKTYSVNEANVDSFPAKYQRFLARCRAAGYSSRYVGAMVADVHRVLLQGGVFMYPPTAKAPGGKLRLMYECNPLAYIVSQAGGMATTGDGPVLEVPPTGLHQRVPIVIGSPDDVQAFLDA